MKQTVFLSWQSDLPETRSVVQWALERAVRSLNRGDKLEQALRVDQDTENVAGSEPVNDFETVRRERRPYLARLPQLSHDFDDFSSFDSRSSLISLSPIFVTPL